MTNLCLWPRWERHHWSTFGVPFRVSTEDPTLMGNPVDPIRDQLLYLTFLDLWLEGLRWMFGVSSKMRRDSNEMNGSPIKKDLEGSPMVDSDGLLSNDYFFPLVSRMQCFKSPSVSIQILSYSKHFYWFNQVLIKKRLF